MKFKLTSTRVSLLALSAFGALVAQELMRSDAPAPSATPPGSKFKRKATVQPLATVPSTAQLLSPPETLAVAQSSPPKLVAHAAQKQSSAQPKQSKAPQPADILLTPPPPSLSESISLPPPPRMATINAQLKTVNVDSLPIDEIVNASLSTPGGAEPRSAGVSKPAVEVTSKVEEKQDAEKATLPPPSINAAQSSSPSAGLPQLASAPLPPEAPPAATQLVSRAMPPAQAPQPSSAQPNPNAVDQDYTLGAGDRIKVEIFNVPEYSKEYQVLVNGSINLHRAGSLSVAGLTLNQAGQVIAAKYASKLKRPTVDVGLLSARSLNVTVAGEINRPGSYSLTLGEGGKFPTVTKIIREAGGMTRTADPRQVVLRRTQRDGVQEVRLNLWELFQTGNINQDISLRDGDTIYIPPASQLNLAEAAQLASANFAVDSNQPINIAVVGEVNRPGPYALVRNNSTTIASNGQTTTAKAGLPTLTQALQEAGGITSSANIRAVEVRRTTRSGTVQAVKVDLWKLLREGDLSQDLVLQQGDTIAVPTATAIDLAEAKALGGASFAPAVMRINVVGEVVRAGTVEVPPNSPLNQALLAAGGFTKDAKRRSVTLVRLNLNGSVSRQEVPIDLAKGIDPQNNPILQNNDVIIVEKSGGAKFRDNVLDPITRFLPFRLLGF